MLGGLIEFSKKGIRRQDNGKSQTPSVRCLYDTFFKHPNKEVIGYVVLISEEHDDVAEFEHLLKLNI
ncbi:hypothetical protein WG66_002425 [Moniliophthora roreri]|nr:hypothetical protein WG66_002425 [Moniliophthora roreri]